MTVDTVALRWFQQVADGTTVTELADLETVSQPGISRALARLEREVGVPLLRRSGRTLKMTRAGATFKRYVDNLLHDLDDGLAALNELASPDTGTVAIVFSQSLGSWLVPDLVASFRVRQPDVRFVLHQQRDELSTAPLLAGEADLEITTAPPGGDTIRWRPLLAEPLQLAVPDGHQLAGRSSVSLAETAEHPFVMLRRTYALRRQSETLCQAAGFTPRIAFEGDDLSTVTGFVAAGLGIAIVPTPRSAGTPRNLHHVRLDDRGASRDIGIAWSTGTAAAARGRELPPSRDRPDSAPGLSVAAGGPSVGQHRHLQAAVAAEQDGALHRVAAELGPDAVQRGIEQPDVAGRERQLEL